MHILNKFSHHCVGYNGYCMSNYMICRCQKKCPLRDIKRICTWCFAMPVELAITNIEQKIFLFHIDKCVPWEFVCLGLSLFVIISS